MTYQEVEKLVTEFEHGTYPVALWNHRAHVLMALWYTYHQPLPQARKSIKEGIKLYNVSVKGKNTDRSGYHETLTELYIRVIAQYHLTFDDNDFNARLELLDDQPFLDKSFPFRYYRKELLMSKEARRQWISPDLKPLVNLEFVVPT
ncbi:hypothetical protein [Tunicatimonas pelagia]|uniref:hypothetical protein n=1 Tax=Tunicatimonas pelagia TaxID=931531 RepID=UPI002665BC78|nr:hypothetical protein [Tunicatimonas pelagia]WKN45778.1 hypothetical protein P0M28_12500 [Tunicatimonas pelagia]